MANFIVGLIGVAICYFVAKNSFTKKMMKDGEKDKDKNNSDMNFEIIKIEGIPNVGNSRKDIENKLKGKYVSENFDDSRDVLEYKMFVYSNILKMSFKAEIDFRVVTWLFHRDKSKQPCIRRIIRAPIQTTPEFINFFNKNYRLIETNVWEDYKNQDCVHKVMMKEYGEVWVFSGERGDDYFG